MYLVSHRPKPRLPLRLSVGGVCLETSFIQIISAGLVCFWVSVLLCECIKEVELRNISKQCVFALHSFDKYIYSYAQATQNY